MAHPRLSRMISRLALALAAAVMTPCLAMAQTLTWTGAAGNGYAGTAGNWSPAVTPTTTHDLVIPAGAGTVNVNGISVRSISTRSPLTNTSSSIFSIGVLTINSGTLELLDGAVMTVLGGADANPGIYFVGDCSLTGTGKVVMNGNSYPQLSIRNGTLTIGPQMTIETSHASNAPPTIGTTGGAGTIINQGTIRSLSGFLVFASDSGLLTLVNQGTISASGGNVGFGYWNSNCCSTRGLIQWTNTGTFAADGSNFYLYGASGTLNGISQTNGGKVIIVGAAPGTTLPSRSDGQRYYLGFPSWNPRTADFQNLTIAADAEIVAFSFTSGFGVRFLDSLTLQNNAKLRINGPLEMVNMQLRGTGTIELPLYTLRQSGSGPLEIAPGALISFSGSSSGLWGGSLDLGTQLTNRGTLRFTGGGSPRFYGVPGTILNLGTVSADAGTTVTLPFTFNGASGSVSAIDNATINLTGALLGLGTVTTSTGGRVFINGVPVRNTITSPPGGMTITDTQTWTDVTLSGTFTFSGCGKANITGGLALAPGTVINLASPTCAGDQLNFVGTTPQSITGSGEIIGAGGVGLIRSDASLTIGAGVTLRTGAGDLRVTVPAAGTVTNQGTLRIAAPGRTIELIAGAPSNPITLSNAGSFELASGVQHTLAFDVTNQGTIRIEPGATLTLPTGRTLTNTGGTILILIDAPGLAPSAGRLRVGGSFAASGQLSVDYQQNLPWTTCQRGVLLIDRLTFRASLTGAFTQTTFPGSTPPVDSRIRLSSSGYYFASTIVADVASIGGRSLPDGQFTADDLIYFIDRLVSADLAIADIARIGGSLTPDGQITADDIIAFLNSAFAGCP